MKHPYSRQIGAVGRRRAAFPMMIVAALPLLLAGCQDEQLVVSLEEAKKITASFEGQSFVPPPRTITDVTAILDAQKRDDPIAAREINEALNAQPPATAKRRVLAEFYYDRGRLARDEGRMKQSIDDLRMAYLYADKFDSNTMSKLMRSLARAESYWGQKRLAIKHMEEAVSITRKIPRKVSWTSILSRWAVMTGNYELAQRYLDQATEYMDEVRSGGGRRATRIWARAGESMTLSVERARGFLLERSGKLDEAEKFYRASLRKAVRIAETNDSRKTMGKRRIESTRRALGRLLVQQGRLAEAEVEIRAALLSALKRSGRYGSEVAKFTGDLAWVMSAQGRARDAEALARAAIEINQRINSIPSSGLMLRSRRYLARALLGQERWAAALAEYRTMIAALDKTGRKKGSVRSSSGYALALLKTGNAREAVKIARRAVRRYQKRVGKKHIQTTTARSFLAMAQAGVGNDTEALKEFRASVRYLLQRSRRSDDEGVTKTGRDRRLQYAIETYIDVLARIRGTAAEREAGIDAAHEAFRMAEVIRGQTVQRALAASAARAAAKNGDLADMVRREQDALKRIGALNNVYANAVSIPTDQQDANAIQTLRVRINSLRAARAALAGEIEKRFPDYAALINPKPATVADLRSALGPGEAVIATYVGAEKTSVWAVPKTGKIAFAAAPMGRTEVAATVAALRRALDPQAATLGAIPKFDVARSYALYKALLEPVAAGWKDAKSLLVVAYDTLGQLPFSVLVTGPPTLPEPSGAMFSNYRNIPWLARSHAVTVLPSVSSLAMLRNIPPPKPGRRNFIGFGDSMFSTAQQIAAAGVTPREAKAEAIRLASRGVLAVRGLPLQLRAAPRLEGVASADLAMLPRLPDTADEVRSMALAMKADLTRDVFIGKRASESVVKSLDLSGYRVLAFATHGLVPGDLNGLTQPTLALSAPAVTGDKSATGCSPWARF